MAIELCTEEAFRQNVLSAQKPVLVDFHAKWCGPCKVIDPTLASFERMTLDVPVFKVDIDDLPEVAMQFRIQSVPALLVFKGGAPIAQRNGALTLMMLKIWIEEVVR